MSASQSSPTQVTFYLDVRSPYSFFAFNLVKQLKIDADQAHVPFNLTLVPAETQEIWKLTGNPGPTDCAAKGNWVLGSDLRQVSQSYGIKIVFPTNLMEILTKNHIPLLVVTAVQILFPEKLYATFEVFERFTWQEDKNIIEEAVQSAALTAAGFTAAEKEKIFTAAKSPATAERLTRNGEQAVAAGAFGLPTFILSKPGLEKNEFFWGADRVYTLAHFLGVKNWRPYLTSAGASA